MKKERDLSILYKWPEDKQISRDEKEISEEINIFVKKRWKTDKYKYNKRCLKKALDDYEKIYSWKLLKPYSFFFLNNKIDWENKLIKAKFNQVQENLTKNINNINFFEIEIWKISRRKQRRILRNEKFKEYRHFLERIFIQSKYNLSEKEEKILNIKSKTSYENWVQMIEDFLSREQTETLTYWDKKELKTFEELMTLTKDSKKEIRDDACKNINQIINKYLDVAEIEINSVLEHKKQNDELRKLPRPDTSRHISDDIKTETVDTLIKTVTKNFEISNRYYKIKSKILKLDKLQYHERNVPIWEIKKIFSYEDAVNIIKNVFWKLDNEFLEIFNHFSEEWLIDVYPKTSKSGWAFNVSFGKNEPNFVMLNYTWTINDITTIAHEMWHAINTTLNKKQNWLNFGYWMATAEVASIFMEDFVLSKLLEDATPEEKLIIQMEKLNDIISSVFRQVACYNFETSLHKNFREKWYLSKEEIWKIFQENMYNYMWKFVEQSEWSENRRVYRSHIRNFFYVYSYASWLIISKSLQKTIKEKPEFIIEIKDKFLSAWFSKSPEDIFKSLWIDINNSSFRIKWIQEIKDFMDETEKLAESLWYI